MYVHNGKPVTVVETTETHVYFKIGKSRQVHYKTHYIFNLMCRKIG